MRTSPKSSSKHIVFGSQPALFLTGLRNRDWREKQAEEIKARDEASRAKRQETIGKAERAIDQFYEEYAAKKERSIRENKCVLCVSHAIHPAETRVVKGARGAVPERAFDLAVAGHDLAADLRRHRAPELAKQDHRADGPERDGPHAVQGGAPPPEA